MYPTTCKVHLVNLLSDAFLDLKTTTASLESCCVVSVKHNHEYTILLWLIPELST